MTARPIRLQLSRGRGFDLQSISRNFNGLDAVNVTRAGRWGNPFVVTDKIEPGKGAGGMYIAVPTVEDAVECFRLMLGEKPEFVVEIREHLRGKNLACWCKPGGKCHADVLLEIANAEEPAR